MRRSRCRVALRPLALGLTALVAGIGCGADRAPARVSVDDARVALGDRLTERHLSFRWIVCLDEGARHAGEVVFRCNVNFGAPHIPGYCVVVRKGRAVTHVEEPSLRCRRERGRE